MASETIVPRWEWRCFAPSLAELVTKAHVPPDVQARESDETYILRLAADSADNIKIRGGVLDVKRLLATSEAGLQQWRPVFKASFPLRRSNMEEIFGRRKFTDESYTLSDLLAFVAGQHDLRAVNINKSRRGFSYGGCIAEIARVSMSGLALDTFSLEHEEPTRVVAALAALGLDGHVNTSYPKGLISALILNVLPVHA